MLHNKEKKITQYKEKKKKSKEKKFPAPARAATPTKISMASEIQMIICVMDKPGPAESSRLPGNDLVFAGN